MYVFLYELRPYVAYYTNMNERSVDFYLYPVPDHYWSSYKNDARDRYYTALREGGAFV